MPQRESTRRQRPLQRRRADAGLHGDDPRLAVELQHPRHRPHIQRDHRCVLASQRRYSSDHARATAPRHHGDGDPRAQIEHGAHLLVTGGSDHGIGRSLGPLRRAA